eukprot:scaffold1809_cov386-Prasinococcus_capsulatus_cf.AAC.45
MSRVNASAPCAPADARPGATKSIKRSALRKSTTPTIISGMLSNSVVLVTMASASSALRPPTAAAIAEWKGPLMPPSRARKKIGTSDEYEYAAATGPTPNAAAIVVSRSMPTTFDSAVAIPTAPATRRKERFRRFGLAVALACCSSSSPSPARPSELLPIAWERDFPCKPFLCDATCSLRRSLPPSVPSGPLPVARLQHVQAPGLRCARVLETRLRASNPCEPTSTAGLLLRTGRERSRTPRSARPAIPRKVRECWPAHAGRAAIRSVDNIPACGVSYTRAGPLDRRRAGAVSLVLCSYSRAPRPGVLRARRRPQRWRLGAHVRSASLPSAEAPRAAEEDADDVDARGTPSPLVCRWPAPRSRSRSRSARMARARAASPLASAPGEGCADQSMSPRAGSLARSLRISSGLAASSSSSLSSSSSTCQFKLKLELAAAGARADDDMAI